MQNLDHLNKRLKRTLIDFWTQDAGRSNDATRFRNLYPMNKMPINNTKSNQLNQFGQFGHLNYLINTTIDALNAPGVINSDSRKQLTLNQFINHYFQSKSKHRHHLLKAASSKRNYFNVYSHFDLVDTFLDLRLNASEQIRDQINEVYLANTIDDELFKESSVHSSTIVLWSIGDHTRARLANRLHLNSVLVAQFILSMLPGSISKFRRICFATIKVVRYINHHYYQLFQ